jgi:hypothetical protein
MEGEDDPLRNVKEQLQESQKQQDNETTPDKETSSGEDTSPDEAAATKEDGPPFDFDQTHQRPLYPHKDSWEEWEDAKFQAEGILRKHEVRNVQGREFDDALIQMGIENPEMLAEIVLEARGIDPDE